MKKRLISAFVAISMIVAAIPASFADNTKTEYSLMEATASGTCGDNLTWELDENGTLTISGEGDMGDDRQWSEYREQIKEVKISDGVTSIRAYAFSNYLSLERVTLPDTVTSIEAYAFYNCLALINVNTVTSATSSDSGSIEQYAFEGCTALTSVTLPSHISSIGDYVFDGCRSLENIQLPNFIESIGDSAFSNCSTLGSIEIPETLSSIGNSAFSGCATLSAINVEDGNSFFSSSDGVLFNKSKTELIMYPIGKSSVSYTIPDGVTSIGDYAFSGCTELESIALPESVTSIGNAAFYNCTSFTDVYYSGTKKMFAAIDMFGNSDLINATIHCSDGNLDFEKTITAIGICGDNLIWVLDNDGLLTISGNGAMYDYSLNLANYSLRPSMPWYSYTSRIKQINIENSVTTIGAYAFYECGDITSATLPSNLSSVGNYAFYRCTSLADIVLPDSVTALGEYSFYGCSALTDITLSANLTSLNRYALSSCTALENINLPDKITSIGEYTFSNCTSLTNIILPSNLTTLGNYSFDNCTSIENITLPSKITSIGEYAFSNCSSLKSITLPDSVTTIGNFAFNNCSLLETITIPEYVISVNGSAFNGCINLSAIYVDLDNEHFCSEDGVLYNKSKSEILRYPEGKADGYTISDSVTIIGDYAFSGCKSLNKPALPQNITSIGRRAFSDCTSLESIVIPDSVTEIGAGAFASCTLLESAELPKNMTSLGNLAFNGCKSLKNITIPQDIDTINIYTFANCSSLESIVIPTSVSLIDTYAFSNCTSLTDVYYTGTSKQWDELTIYYDGNSIIRNNAEIHYNYNPSSTDATPSPTSGADGKLIDSGECGKSLTWKFYDNGLIIISGKGEMDNSWSYKETPPWYSYISQITDVNIESGVTSIGRYAFCDCTALKNVTISDTVENIYEYAFYECPKLTDVYYTAGEKEWYAINIDKSNSSLDKVTIHYNDTSGEPTTEPTDEPATDPTAEPTAEPTTEPTAEPTADPILEYLTFDSSTGKITATNNSISGDFVIPDTIGGVAVTAIGDEAFKDRNNLTSVTLPSGITSIGHKAFSGCSGLTELILPDTVTWIGGLFIENTKISEITVPASVTSNGYYWRSEESNIANGPFGGCPSLKKVVLSDGITSIRKGLFACLDESGIEEIVIPDTVTSIGEYAFRNCKKLTSISIPDGVTSIGNYAFLDCSSLTELELPAGLESLGARFIQGTSIEEITVPKSLRKITYYYGNLDWQAGYSLDGFSVLRAGPFAFCDTLKKVILEDGLTTIYTGMFATTSTSNIETIVIPDSVTEIQSSAFAGCNGLKAMKLPEGLQKIGEASFWNCTGLKSVNIPKTVTTIASKAFEGCSALTDVEFEENDAEGAALRIDNRVFRNCKSLKSLTLPHHVTYLGYLFIMYTPISSIVVPKSVKEVGGFYYKDGNDEEFAEVLRNDNRKKGPFSACPNLKTVILEDGMTSIPKYMFSTYNFYCYIENVHIPDSVTSIGEYAFDQCNYLKNIEISDNVTSIGKNAFRGCDNLTVSCSESAPAIASLVNSGTKFILNKTISEYEHFDIENTSYVSLSSNQSGYIPMRVNYAVKDSVEITDKKIEVRIPTNTTLVLSSITLNGISVSGYSYDDDILTVPVTDDSGTLSFCVRPDEYSTMLTYARMTFREDDTSKTEMIGVLNCSIENITIVAPSVTSSSELSVKGIASPSSEVTIFIDGEEAGKVQANKLGDYTANIKIPSPKNKMIYTITAKSLKDGTEVSAQTEVTYDEATPELESLTMSWCDHFNIWHKCVMEENVKPVAVFYPKMGLIFEARFKNDEMIDKVFIVSTKNGQSYKMEAFPDSASQCYKASGFFEGAGVNYIPGTLTVEYTLKESRNTSPTPDELLEYLDNDFKESTAEILQSDENSFKSEINVSEGQREQLGDKIKIDVTSKSRNYNNVNINELIVNDNMVSTYELEDDDKHIVVSTDTSDEEHLIITIHDLINNEEITASIGAVKIVMSGDTQTEQAVNISNLLNNFADMNKSALNAYNLPNASSFTSGLNGLDTDILTKEIIGELYTNLSVGFLIVSSAIVLVSAAPAGLGAAFLSTLGFATVEIAELSAIYLSYVCGAFKGARFIIDPSGYVYEAVTTNHLEGVTATAYWIEPENIDEEGNGDETKAIIWDALEYSQQNPIRTDSSGVYAWEVPEGLWQVKFEKDGYETQTTEWMPVPPIQTDINIGLVSKATPQIENLELSVDELTITFDKYMKPDTVTNVTIGDYTYTMDYSKNETAPDGTVYARSYVFTLNKPVQTGEKIALSVKNAESYAGIKMADYTGEIECKDYVIKIGEVSNDGEKLSVPFINIAGETQNFTAICAFYDENGALLSTEVIPDITVNAQETENKAFNINGYWCSYKIFAWDSVNTMRPVAVNK